MNKRFLIFSLFVVLVLAVRAQGGHQSTNDKVTFSTREYVPGGKTAVVTISLEGSLVYTACEMDIYIPDGYSFEKLALAEGTSGIFPVTNQDEIDEFNDLDEDEQEEYIDEWGSAPTPKYGSHTLGYNLREGNILRLSILSLSGYDFSKKKGQLLKLTMKASPYVKPGFATFSVKGCHFITSDATQYNATDITISDKVYASSESTLSLAVNGNIHWSTCILPFDAALPSGVTAYTCVEKKDDKVYLRPAESMEAYTPYILYSESGYSGTLSGTVDATQYPESGYVCKDGLLYGAIVPQEISEGYVLQNLDGGVKFYKCNEQFTYNIPAGKCWLRPETASASSLAFEIEDPTGIKEVNSVNVDNAIYTLDGKKVDSPLPNSIYVKAGKKFVNK